MAGCNRDGKYPVSGTVSWNGEPIEKGHITLTPVDPSIGPDAGLITNGSFSFRASPGEKKVEILADRPIASAKANAVMGGLVPHEQYIPVRYNEQTELAWTINKTTNAQDFELVEQKGDRRAGSLK